MKVLKVYKKNYSFNISHNKKTVRLNKTPLLEVKYVADVAVVENVKVKKTSDGKSTKTVTSFLFFCPLQ